MGCVPYSHLGRELLRWDPIDHQVVAGCKATTLKDIVEHQQHSHDDDHAVDEVGTGLLTGDPVADDVTEAEDVIDQSTRPQTYDEMPSGIGPVPDDAVDKLRYAIYDAYQRQNDAETGIGDTVFSAQNRHGKREILTHEIEECIRNHGAEDHPPLPVPETVPCLIQMSENDNGTDRIMVGDEIPAAVRLGHSLIFGAAAESLKPDVIQDCLVRLSPAVEGILIV